MVGSERGARASLASPCHPTAGWARARSAPSRPVVRRSRPVVDALRSPLWRPPAEAGGGPSVPWPRPRSAPRLRSHPARRQQIRRHADAPRAATRPAARSPRAAGATPGPLRCPVRFPARVAPDRRTPRPRRPGRWRPGTSPRRRAGAEAGQRGRQQNQAGQAGTCMRSETSRRILQILGQVMSVIPGGKLRVPRQVLPRPFCRPAGGTRQFRADPHAMVCQKIWHAVCVLAGKTEGHRRDVPGPQPQEARPACPCSER